MVALNNTSTEALLRRAAYWRSRGLSWKQVGEKMNANPEELEELSQIHDKRYRKYLENADKRTRLEERQESGLALRNQLVDDDPKTVQRSADIICRVQVDNAHIDLQRRKQNLELKQLKVRELEAQAQIAAAAVEATRDRRPKSAKPAFEWSEDYHDWFPNSPEGYNALGIYEYVLLTNAQQLAADRERDFREQCVNRQIQLPDADPLPFWMRPDFDQHCRAAVGWTPGSIERYAHDILAINQPGSPPNMTDVIRKYAEMVRDGW